MKQLTTIILSALISIYAVAQETKKDWQGSANVEFSQGIAGYASDLGYMSAGLAASYGILLNDHYFIGLGLKPNYIFSDGDFDGLESQ